LIFNEYSDIKTLLFSIGAVISTSATIYLIIYILTRLFFRFTKAMFIVLGVIFLMIDFALIIDFIIFKVWKFHINAMVLNIITSPAAYDSIQIEAVSAIMIILIVLSLVFVEYFLYKKLNKISEWKVNANNNRFNKFIIPIILIIVVVEKISYGMADVYNKETILESVKPIPLYQPLTFVRFVEKNFGIKAVKRDKNSLLVKTASKVNYPLNELKIKKNAASPNIFIFAFDAVNNSVVNKEVSPNIFKFSKDSLVFNNHFSGGNATRFGIFSLFYGINSTYWFTFLNASKGAVIFDILKQKDYQINITSSTDTKWPEFQQSVYCSVSDCIKDSFEGTPAQKDAQSRDSFIKWLDSASDNKPMFSFVFLDSPHGYSYPKEFEKYKPNNGNSGINYLTVKKENRLSLLNTYKNSIYYNDKLFGDMIEAIKQKGLYDNSIIIFTSDHGQEFFEYGFFGHNSAFSRSQVSPPFIMHLPNKEHRDIDKMTSHLDVPATLLSILGVENPPSDYSNGSNMLDIDFHRDYTFVAKWNKNAIITDKYVYIFSNLPNELFKNEIRDFKTFKKIKKPQDENIQKILLEILDQNRKFLY
jgi:membrane-anchored protein YejM (alkaline phosphatase superfamily)